MEQRYQFLLLLTSLKFFICLLLLLSRFSRVRLYATHRRQPIRLRRPWDSPGKNTGVSCHFLLQCMKVKSESEVAQLCPILSDPMDCSLPGSSAHGIFQARVLEWGVIASAKSKLILSCLLYYPNTGGGGRENPQLLLWIFYPGIWPLSFPFLEAHTK